MDRVRGRVRQVWGDITDDDIDQAQGNTENLIGRIKEKTGDTAENIRDRLQQLFDEDDQEVRGS
jgi:uncharacterized protein YjbJ (UPF0337 family)